MLFNPSWEADQGHHTLQLVMKTMFSHLPYLGILIFLTRQFSSHTLQKGQKDNKRNTNRIK